VHIEVFVAKQLVHACSVVVQTKQYPGFEKAYPLLQEMQSPLLIKALHPIVD